jgi:hypothetical protein
MAINTYYRHLNGYRHRCEIIEETETQVRVRLSEESARELKFDTELWLPRSYVMTGEDGEGVDDGNNFQMTA